MSLPRRLWRLARHSVRSVPIDVSRWAEELRAPTDDARVRQEAQRELEEFLGTAPPTPPDPSPPPHPFARQYAILQVPAGADAATVERAWRRLVLQNHPDRFQGDPAAERAAGDRLREINQAHDELMAWLRRNGNGRERG